MTTSYNHADYLFNLVQVGESGVGKSSLMLRFTDNLFHPTTVSTIGIDMRTKTIDFAEDGKHVKLMIRDTAGQERFRSIRASYYRNVHGAIVVYAVNSRASFDAIKSHWLPELRRELSDPDVPKILVGNKCDVSSDQRRVTVEEGQALARSLGMMNFVETSALDGTAVDRMFLELATTIYQTQRQAALTVAIGTPTPKLLDTTSKRSSLFEDIDDLMLPPLPPTKVELTPTAPLAKKKNDCCK